MTPEDTAKIQELQDRLKARGRGCGTCTACCTIMAVDMTPMPEPSKPERVKCGHLCKAGCKIYEDKPDSCTAFMCIWLAMEMFDPSMPRRWRPDRVGAVVDVNDVGTITVHLKHENAWQTPGDLRDMLLYLTQMDHPIAPSNFVVLDRPSGNHLLFKRNGTTQELVSIGLSPNGNRQYRTKFPGEQ